jgi:hypothetical protein
MTRFAPIPSRLVLFAGIAACALVASPARAEVPSLDAYAGQALVLGKPHPPSMGGVVGARKGAAASGGANASGQAGSPSRGAGGANASGHAESPSRGAGGSGTGGPASGTRARATGSGQPRSPRGSSGNPSGAGKGANGAAYDLRAAQPAARSSDLQAAQRAANSSALAGSDVLLLVVGVACVAGVGAALRLSRWKRHPRPDYTQSA